MPEIRIKSSHPETQGEFVDIEGEHFDPDIHELYEAAGESVEIPADWEQLQWKRRVALAQRIAGGDDEITAELANLIISEEVAKRAGA